MLKKTNLENGLRVLTFPQESSESVCVLVLVGTGSKNETKEQNGISHFLEHMFFKGTTKRPTPIEVAEVLDRVGGAYNAFTGEDYTGYYAKVDASHVDLALDWVADIFLSSLLPVEEIEKEKGVVIEELHMRNDSPMSRAQILWRKLLYGDQPAGWNIVGTKESVMGLSRQDLVAYIHSQYVASNTIVCVTGKLPKDVEGRVAEKFGSVATADFRHKAPVAEEQTEPGLLTEDRTTDQVHLCLGVRAYSLTDPRRYAQEILATVLGGMMSSRMFMEVREKRGLAYYVSTDSETDPDTGFVVTAAGVRKENVEDAVKVMLEEYRKIATERIPIEEFQKAKDNLRGKLALSLEPSDAKASFYGLQELLENETYTLEQLYDRINAVTQDDVLRLAQDIFKPAKLNLALVGPAPDRERLTKLLLTI
ncbi:MAG: pitrilysin family protein [bacterium]|nr:pitrilysin family protein [bacterium]